MHSTRNDREIKEVRRGKPRAPSLVKSPCIKVCKFDDSGEYCVGCLRTATEMRDWYTMSDADKNLVLERIECNKN